MPLLAGVVALVVYLWILPGVSGMGDGPEFTVGLATGGLVHPTGYPIYTMAGHLFVRALHAAGMSWPWAANAWSAVGAATAVALFFALARGLARDEPALRGGAASRAGGGASREGAAASRAPSLVALVPTLVLALNPVLLAQAAEAEVNTWALAWTAGAALLFVHMVRRIEARAPLAPRDALAWGLLCGAGLAHHLTSILVALPLTVALVVASRGRLRPRPALAAAGGTAIPLLAYAFVAWRAAHPAPGQWREIAPTLAGLLEHVTGARYRMFLGFFAPDEESRRLLAAGIYPILLPGLVLLAVAGALVSSRERRALWWGIASAAVMTALFGFSYGVPDPEPYLLPAALLALLGLVPLAGAIASSRAGSRALAALGVVALIAIAALASSGLREARARGELALGFDHEVRRLWALVPADSAILLWPADQVARLVEYQVLRGENRAVRVATPESLLDPATREEMRSRFGVDPAEGLEVPFAPRGAPWGEAVRRRFLARVVTRLNDGTRVPVYWFDPTIPRLARLPKA